MPVSPKEIDSGKLYTVSETAKDPGGHRPDGAQTFGRKKSPGQKGRPALAGQGKRDPEIYWRIGLVDRSDEKSIG